MNSLNVTIIHLSPREFSFVLTNALFQDDAGDHQHYNNIKSAAERRAAKFIPARLVISDTAEHAKRIVSPERGERLKLTDPAAARKYAETKELLHIDHPNVLTLDVTALSASDAANIILKHAVKN